MKILLKTTGLLALMLCSALAGAYEPAIDAESMLQQITAGPVAIDTGLTLEAVEPEAVLENDATDFAAVEFIVMPDLAATAIAINMPRGEAVAASQTHTLEYVGSIPAPATTFSAWRLPTH